LKDHEKTPYYDGHYEDIYTSPKDLVYIAACYQYQRMNNMLEHVIILWPVVACAKLKKIRDSPWRFMSMSLAEVSQPQRKKHLFHHCLRMGYTGYIPYTPENGHEKWGT